MNSARFGNNRIILPASDSIIKNAHLKFLNVEKVIADAKSNRSSRHDAFLSCLYENSMDCFFMKRGELINVVRFEHSDRFFVSLTSALNKAKRSQKGYITMDKTSPNVFALLCESILYAPIVRDLPSSVVSFKDLVKELNRKKFNGFIELEGEFDLNYVVFESGLPKKTYLSHTFPSDKEKKIMVLISEQLLHYPYKISVYETPQAACSEIYEQSPPHLVNFLSKIVSSVIKELRSGRKATPASYEVTIHATREKLIADYPLIRMISIDLEGNLVYNGISTAETFVETVASWLAMMVIMMTDGESPVYVNKIHKVLEPHRVTLDSIKFYNYFYVL